MNDIEVSECYPLSRNGRFVAWVHRLHVFDSRIVVERCENETSDTVPKNDEQAGGTFGILEELRVADSEVAFRALNLPDWSLVAQPTLCRGRVAYWAAVPDSGTQFRIFLQVWDVTTRKVLAREFFRNDGLETDYSYYLPEITWADDGGSVRSGHVVVAVRPN